MSYNFPKNPTGKILPSAIFDALVDICSRRGIWLFSDVVYRLIERDPAPRLPQAVDVYERGITSTSCPYATRRPPRRAHVPAILAKFK